jgi:hypothetical protein
MLAPPLVLPVADLTAYLNADVSRVDMALAVLHVAWASRMSVRGMDCLESLEKSGILSISV